MKKIISILCVFVIFSACKKDTVITPTSADQITAQILNVFKSNNVQRINC
jgi:hypothetical protein